MVVMIVFGPRTYFAELTSEGTNKGAKIRCARISRLVEGRESTIAAIGTVIGQNITIL